MPHATNHKKKVRARRRARRIGMWHTRKFLSWCLKDIITKAASRTVKVVMLAPEGVSDDAARALTKLYNENIAADAKRYPKRTTIISPDGVKIQVGGGLPRIVMTAKLPVYRRSGNA